MKMDAGYRTKQWREPVIVQDGILPPVIIKSPEEVLEYMDVNWPTESGKHHRIAREVCAAATKHHVSIEAARENFIIAALEARIKVCTPGEEADA
jgi:hypothetical protein